MCVCLNIALVMTDPKWQFDCCGVIAAWELKAQANAAIDMQVWDLTDLGNRGATLLYANSINGAETVVCLTCCKVTKVKF